LECSLGPAAMNLPQTADLEMSRSLPEDPKFVKTAGRSGMNGTLRPLSPAKRRTGVAEAAFTTTPSTPLGPIASAWTSNPRCLRRRIDRDSDGKRSDPLIVDTELLPPQLASKDTTTTTGTRTEFKSRDLRTKPSIAWTARCSALDEKRLLRRSRDGRGWFRTSDLSRVKRWCLRSGQACFSVGARDGGLESGY
jgi:hypothetical protein